MMFGLVLNRSGCVRLTDNMASNVPLVYISGFVLNFKNKSTNCGMILFDNAI